jgi:very-short-patch-repair endonuclease
MNRFSEEDLANLIANNPSLTIKAPWTRWSGDGTPIPRPKAETPARSGKGAKAARNYKADMEQMLKLLKIDYETEFRFHPKRKWRSDYRIKNTKVLIEFEGGLFAQGKQGHSSVSGILRDICKYNSAALLGYTVIRIAPNHVINGQAINWILAALKY